MLFRVMLALATPLTYSSAAVSTSKGYTSDAIFESMILDSTNRCRANYRAAAVSWNKTLASYAEDYLQNRDCIFAHSGGPYGENLAAGYEDVSSAVEAWCNESKHYDFALGEYGSTTGHFTQVVWKATRDVGCGRVNCGGANGTPGWYVVCEYWPRGNIIGEFKGNVEGPSSTLADQSVATSRC